MVLRSQCVMILHAAVVEQVFVPHVVVAQDISRAVWEGVLAYGGSGAVSVV